MQAAMSSDLVPGWKNTRLTHTLPTNTYVDESILFFSTFFAVVLRSLVRSYIFKPAQTTAGNIKISPTLKTNTQLLFFAFLGGSWYFPSFGKNHIFKQISSENFPSLPTINWTFSFFHGIIFDALLNGVRHYEILLLKLGEHFFHIFFSKQFCGYFLEF